MKSVEQRLYSKSIPDSDCLMWMGYKNEDGYGKIRVNGKSLSTHRVSWEINSGDIPVGFNVLHKCDKPACIKIDHLFLGTQLDNVRDMFAKGRDRNYCREKTHCINGHQFSSENTYLWRNQRHCKTCRRISEKRRCLAKPEKVAGVADLASKTEPKGGI